MNILGIETSCDETAAAVYRDNSLLSNIIASQDVHKDFGGVVPELASRAHQKLIVPVIEQSLKEAKIKKEQIDGIAVTAGPGLAGSLLVGLSFAKSMALGLGVPLIGINHLEAHLWSWKIGTQEEIDSFMSLTVSGGHCLLSHVKGQGEYELMGSTHDDAPGEAFDKVAKLLNLGYPGGPVIDGLSKEGNSSFVKFPRPEIRKNNYDFSFSGLKTAVLYYVRQKSEKYVRNHIADISASFQQAVVDVLVHKTFKAVHDKKVDTITVTGGVAANSLLKNTFKERGKREGFRIIIPDPVNCTDNAAMVAQLGFWKLRRGERSDLSISALPSYPFP